MDTFVFVKRAKKLPTESKAEIVNLNGLDNILDESMSKHRTHGILFERYRQESGDLDAQKINWRLLDRRNVPSKYDKVDINSRMIQFKTIYKNPEIVDNIHFIKAKKIEKLERKRKISDDRNI